jgi:hypothetical protein
MRLTRDQQMSLRAEIEPLAEGLQNDAEVIEKPAAELVEKAAGTMGEGPHAERGTVFGLAAIKNVSIVLVGAAVVTAAATAASGIAGPAQLTGRLQALAPFRNFVIRNEEPLRRIADNTSAMRWMLAYINFIVRHSQPETDRFLSEGSEWEDDNFWDGQPGDPKSSKGASG